MADTEQTSPAIYELPSATNVQGTDKLLLEQSDGDKQITKDELLKDTNASIATELDRAKAAEKANTDSISDKELKNYTLTLAVADVVANTDEYATETDEHNAYPYCVNHAMTGITADYECHINYSSNMAVCDRSWQTFTDNLRIYLRSMPTAAINIEFSMQKGTATS